MRFAGVRGTSGSSVRFGNVFLEHHVEFFFNMLAPLGRFWAPFWPPSDFEGVPKSHFCAKDQHKMRKNEVPEGDSEKHNILMRNPCGKVTFREA
jgi:hypothetical protein